MQVLRFCFRHLFVTYRHGDVTAGHASRVFALKFNPTEPDILISGGWDNTIQIWDMRVAYSVRSIFGPHICGDAVGIPFLFLLFC